MLASGVIAGIVVGVIFGGDWRRLSTLSLALWPLLVVALGLRVIGILVPASPVWLYLASLVGTGVVAFWNWRIPGAPLIAIGTALNFVVSAANGGMPYDPALVSAVGAPPPNDGLHIVIRPDTQLHFLADVIPVGALRSVLSLGDFLVALGGFLIPFMWLQPPVDTKAPRRLRSPNFAFFWMAQVVSRFGDPITLVALTFITYQATQSALWTAFAVVTATVPNALFSFVGGAIADALGYRRSMLLCDLARALAIGSVPLFLAINAPLSVVLVVVLCAGLCGAIFNPARVSLIPRLVDEADLPRANSVVLASDRTVEIAGGIAGGLLVAALGTGAFLVDAITFALSAMLISRVAVNEAMRRITWAQLLRDASDGLRILRHSAILWSNTIFSLGAQVSTPIVNGLAPAFMIQRFANNNPASGAVQYGFAEAAIAVGSVAGSALLPRYVRRFRKGQLLVLGFAATGVVIVAISIAPSLPLAIGLFALLGAANILFYIPNVTILQEMTMPETRARVFGARIALTNLSWLPLIFLSGALADVFSPAVIIAVGGAITLTAALIGSRVRSVYEVA